MFTRVKKEREEGKMALRERSIRWILAVVEADRGYTMSELLSLLPDKFSYPTLRKYLLAMEQDGGVRVEQTGIGGAYYYSFPVKSKQQ